eukprot:NODE_263_length_12530_cov_0.434881.p2 type:complete len:665 gc:universal NODE_263_length_12530_cov_0.434881:4206-2212(-)
MTCECLVHILFNNLPCVMHPSLQFIQPDHLLFEQQLIRNPLDIKTWLRYIDYQNDMIPKLHLYLRALSKCPYYYKLWYQYLQCKLKMLPPNPLYQDLHAIKMDFEICFLFLNQMPRIYYLCLDFLINYMPYKAPFIVHVLNSALLNLPVPLHKHIWSRIVDYSKHLNNQLGALLLQRYYYILTNATEKEDVISLLFKMHTPTAVLTFLRFMKSNQNSLLFIQHIICEYTVELHDYIDIPTLLNDLLSKQFNYKLLNALARYYIEIKDIENCISTFDRGITKTNNVYDLIMIYEQYLFVMEQLCTLYKTSDDASMWMDKYDYLLQRHLLLIQSTLTRQFPNSIDVWRNYIKLQKLLEKPLKPAYQLALQTIDPKRATPLDSIHLLWNDYALECGDAVYDEATNYKFRNTKDLEQMYMIKAKHFESDVEKARSIYKQGVTICSGAALWNAFIDFEESIDSEHVISAYEECIASKQATAQIFMNYIVYLHSNEMFDAMFSIYERGIQSFKSFQSEFYSSYLPLLVEMYKESKVERIRHCFDQCISLVEKGKVLKFINWYAMYELEYGTVRKAINVYKLGATLVNKSDKLNLYREFIKKTRQYYDADSTRQAYTTAIEDLLDDESRMVCMEFIEFELANGEIDRTRELYSWCSQLSNPNVIFTKIDMY